MRFLLISIASILLIMSCNKKQETLFRLLPARETGVDFENAIIESDSFNVLTYTNIYNGGGVAAADFNNDGFIDLFFSGNMVSSEMYLNQAKPGEIKFKNITQQANVATHQWINGVTTVDINQDGWMDIYACSSGSKKAQRRANLLFINQGPNDDGIPVFKEMAKAYNLNDTSYTTHASFLDYDRDGDLDVFMIVNKAENYYRGTVNIPKKTNGKIDKSKSDRLYRNNHIECLNGKNCNEKFSDVSIEANIIQQGYGLGLAISDFNNDQWADIYVSNDFLPNDILYVNNHDGTFTDRAAEYFKHTSYAGMGADAGDINNDANTDIVQMDMTPETNDRQKSMLSMADYNYFKIQLQNGYYPQFSRNTLQLNRGPANDSTILFSEIGRLAGIHHTDWSWSVLMTDYNLDGYKDIYITNGFRRDLQDLDFINAVTRPNFNSRTNKNEKQFLELAHQMHGIKISNYIFENNSNYTFTDQTKKWLGERPSYSNGAAYADLDNDGDLDLIVSNVNDQAYIHENLTNTHEALSQNYLKVKLEGNKYNRDAIGAKLCLFVNSKLQMIENYPVHGFQSSMGETLLFGIDHSNTIDSVRVIWPDGKTTTKRNIAVNQLFTLTYDNPKNVINKNKPTPVFKMADHHNINFFHGEQDFNDFQYQRLIPHKLSQSGPGLAVGYINQDKLEDFIIGSSRYHNPTIFLQQPDGTFKKQDLKCDQQFEELGILLFDADNDGDNDLYFVDGSVEMGYASDYYQDRLYVNDGNGHFALVKKALPALNLSGSTVKAADYDRDGDLDLFIGNRVLPGRYPLPVDSYILRNDTKSQDHPIFTKYETKGFDSLGMVTDATWTDYDNDGWTDLILVGEWMPITIFKNDRGKFNKKIEIAHTEGWWNSILPGDFNNDGNTDYIAGNVGMNQKYKPSPQTPVRIYVNDFDKNGQLDPIFAYFLNGQNMPTHPRDELIEQIPTLKKLFPTYQAYSENSTEDLLDEFDATGTYTVEAEQFASVIIENLGHGEFHVSRLPMEAQFAPVYGMVKCDYNLDGNPDLILSGNSYASDLENGFYDASLGLVLKGNGDNNFEPLTLEESGLIIDSDAKALVKLIDATKKELIISSSNRDSLKAFEMVEPKSRPLKIHNNDAYAIITFDDGRKRKEEFYYGSSYLSQSSRSMELIPSMKMIEIFNTKGESRIINLNHSSGDIASIDLSK